MLNMDWSDIHDAQMSFKYEDYQTRKQMWVSYVKRLDDGTYEYGYSLMETDRSYSRDCSMGIAENFAEAERKLSEMQPHNPK